MLRKDLRVTPRSHFVDEVYTLRLKKLANQWYQRSDEASAGFLTLVILKPFKNTLCRIESPSW